MTTRKPKRRPFGFIALAAIVLVAAGSVTAVAIARSGQRDAITASMTFTAAQGPLTISVSESGTIRARQQEIIQSQVEGQTTLLYLVPEGTQVTKGDLLVELDASRLLDQQLDRSITVQNAEAAYSRATENLEIVRNQAKADISRAKLDSRFAAEDLKNYLEGTFPRDRKDLESRVTMMTEEVRRSAQKLEWSERLFEEGYISETELQADRLAAQRAELDLELAQTNLALLKEFTKPRRIAELESQVEQTEMALERVRRRAQADILQAETDLRVRESELRRQESQLARIERQIENTKIYAPTDGLVVYATTGRGRFRGNEEPLAEGQTVRERQELIHLPRTAAMMAEVSVHESVLDKVRVGLPVRITVDALPGRTYRGRVARVAPLPDAQSIWLNPDLKVYSTEIHIEGDAEGLRTGMSCRAEIIVDQFPEATYVPVQSVLRIGGQPSVYVVGPDGQAQARPVELGQDNNRMAHIISGVDPGDRVLLTPPLGEGTASHDGELFDIPAAVTEASGPAAPSPQARVDDQAQEPEQAEPESPRTRRAGAEGRGDMTPQQMQEMRRRFENMTPEEREAARRQFQRGGGRQRTAEDGQE